MSTIKTAVRPILALTLFGALAGCVSREPTEEVAVQSMPIRTPTERSYLDPGPVPAGGYGPNYVRDNSRGVSSTDDRYGGGIIPRIP